MVRGALVLNGWKSTVRDLVSGDSEGGRDVSDAFTPVKNKCTWWRESLVEEDKYDVRLKPGERRVHCTCFVEGKVWTHIADEVPAECPDARHCRYYIKYL